MGEDEEVCGHAHCKLVPAKGGDALNLSWEGNRRPGRKQLEAYCWVLNTCELSAYMVNQVRHRPLRSLKNCAWEFTV